MSLTDRYRGGQAKPTGASTFTCPHYEPKPGSKRCRHYLEGGACARPDEFMCVEWLKANGHAALPPSPTAETVPERDGAAPAPAERARPTDLFGNSLPDPPVTTAASTKAASPARSQRADVPTDGEERPAPRGLTTEDIDSFKALGVEVCMRSDAFGEVWLVPDYTGNGRKEITPEHAATICRVLEAFPGSQVVSFEKNPKPDKEADV